MLNLNCSICADSFAQTDEVSVTSCGHMFHSLCIFQWLARSETCPQCRQKTKERNIIRLFMNFDNANSSSIDVSALQDDLDNAKLQVRLKTQELQKANSEIQALKEQQETSRNTIKSLQNTVNHNKFAIMEYSEKMKRLQVEVERIEELYLEIKRLNAKIKRMELVNEMMNASAAEAENLLKNENDPKILSIWVATLKRELRHCELKKNDMRNALKIIQNDLRNEAALKKCDRDRIMELESEVYQLQEKNKSLEKLINRNQQTIINNNQPMANMNEVVINDDETLTLNNANLPEPNLYNGLEYASTSTTTQQQQVVSNPNLYNNGFEHITESTAQSINAVNSVGQQIIASPGLNECIRQIEESDSPYLNIKSSNIGLVPLMKNYPNATGGKVLNTRMPATMQHPISTVTSAQSNNNYPNQYTILKRPRLAVASNACATTSKSIPQNHDTAPFNFYQEDWNGTDPKTMTLVKSSSAKLTTMPSKIIIRKVASGSINKRLKSGYLRDFKISK